MEDFYLDISMRATGKAKMQATVNLLNWVSNAS